MIEILWNLMILIFEFCGILFGTVILIALVKCLVENIFGKKG